MTAEIKSIFGGPTPPQPGTPDQATVQLLEELLEKARAGHIIGLAYSATHPDGLSTNTFTGYQTRSSIGSLFAVMIRVSKALGDT